MNEKDYLNTLAEGGCIICGRPAEIHHPRFCAGMSQRSSHWLAIPLCPEHHRLGEFGHAVHNGQATFERNYQTEANLLALTIKRMNL